MFNVIRGKGQNLIGHFRRGYCIEYVDITQTLLITYHQIAIAHTPNRSPVR